MSQKEQPQEGSMEDILSSIRQILSSDDDVPAPVSQKKIDEPLELVDLVEAKEAVPAPVVTKVEEPPVETVAEVAPLPIQEEEPAAAPLLSESTMLASTAALSALKQAPVEVTPLAETPSADKTLEGLTSDLLKPLLKAWLDENLPSVIDKIVREEIQAITRGSE